LPTKSVDYRSFPCAFDIDDNDDQTNLPIDYFLPDFSLFIKLSHLSSNGIDNLLHFHLGVQNMQQKPKVTD
jgi:hypothetical protein